MLLPHYRGVNSGGAESIGILNTYQFCMASKRLICSPDYIKKFDSFICLFRM